MVMQLGSRELIVDGEVYELLDFGRNRIQWDVDRVPSQRGDGGPAVPHDLRFEGGFGASWRYTDQSGRPTAPTHHDYGQNWDCRHLGLNGPAPRITYANLSSIGGGNMRLGGSPYGRLGGGVGAQLGGGTFTDVPQAMETFGDYLYISGGTRTYVVDPSVAAPSLLETRQHNNNARARSMDVFDNELVVALGPNTDAVGAASAYSSTTPTPWATFTDVKMSAYRTGKAGRLFSARNNLVFNVLAGQDPATLANYLPSAGEVISDETAPVRALEEFSRALVASTAINVRTFDPDAGFFSRALLREQRLSPSEYDGFALITIGEILLVGFTRAVWLFRGGQTPINVGPELLEQNESPYVAGEPGVPDFAGEWIYWPYYFPATGDSVIFAIRPRRPGEPGVGPYVWQDWLYLEGRECRVVHYWGGTSSVKPRLFFGAGQSGNPEQVGWVGLGRGGTPDIFNSDSPPALSATIYSAKDDYGLPNTIAEVDRIEFPAIDNADDSNYLVASVLADEDTTYTDLVTDQRGSPDAPRIQETGFQEAFAPVYDPIEGRALKARLQITQAQDATEYLRIRGFPQIYLRFRAARTDQVTTMLDVQTRGNLPADVRAERLRALEGRKVAVQGGRWADQRWAVVERARERSVEVRSLNDAREVRSAIEIVLREVAVDPAE